MFSMSLFIIFLTILLSFSFLVFMTALKLAPILSIRVYIRLKLCTCVCDVKSHIAVLCYHFSSDFKKTHSSFLGSPQWTEKKNK